MHNCSEFGHGKVLKRDGKPSVTGEVSKEILTFLNMFLKCSRVALKVLGSNPGETHKYFSWMKIMVTQIQQCVCSIPTCYGNYFFNMFGATFVWFNLSIKKKLCIYENIR